MKRQPNYQNYKLLFLTTFLTLFLTSLFLFFLTYYKLPSFVMVTATKIETDHFVVLASSKEKKQLEKYQYAYFQGKKVIYEIQALEKVGKDYMIELNLLKVKTKKVVIELALIKEKKSILAIILENWRLS